MEKGEWLPLEPADIGRVCLIAGTVHADLPERPEVFAEKLRLFPEGCRKFAAGGAMAGYALAHPWPAGSAPKLDSLLGSLPAAPGCLYIHDVALLPEARGRGAARAFAAYAERLARGRGLAALALVAVHGTAPVWERLGFAPAPCPGLASYGPGAAYLVRRLGGPE